MFRTTTPYITYYLPNDCKENYFYEITLVQNKIKLIFSTKNGNIEQDLEAKTVSAHLTSEQTANFSPYDDVEIQLRFQDDTGEIYAVAPTTVPVQQVLNEDSLV